MWKYIVVLAFLLFFLVLALEPFPVWLNYQRSCRPVQHHVLPHPSRPPSDQQILMESETNKSSPVISGKGKRTQPSNMNTSRKRKITSTQTETDMEQPGHTYAKRQKMPWWKSSIVYQIYPRSFYDTDGDGIGDLKGITAKADYFCDLGIKAIWISPFFASPMADSGYDISNFVDVDPIFGSLADFGELLKKMHAKDIKVVLDFVPNHSSDEHEWFQKSLRREEPYTDYYIWADPKGIKATGDPIPPNNWLSKFRGSAWEWKEERGQFYYHQYHRKQPDLNYRNPVVQEEMKNVLKFWLDHGVDGFRVDAIKHLYEVKDLNQDEPMNEATVVKDRLNYKYLKHLFTADQPETLKTVREWRKIMDKYPDKLMMVEVYNTIQEVMKYYGNDTEAIADFPFNFSLLKKLQNRSTITGTQLKNIIDEWIENMPEGKWPNWVLGNHDNSRVASRLGTDLVDALNILTLLLPGTPVTYYGEEIGMQDTFISWEDTKDPLGCNFGPDHYQQHSRDLSRTPMQWDASPNGGFSTGKKTWLPVNKNYKSVNAKAQTEDRESHLKVYKTLARLRQENTFTMGKLAFPVITEAVLAFIRYLEGEPTYLVVLNLSEDSIVVDLHHHANLELPAAATIILRSVLDKSKENLPGSEVNLSSLNLVSGEGLVLQLPISEEIE